MLEKGLGLTGPVELGESVRLAPEKLPPIEGVVDYVEPGEDFLAVRTSDGLYRFHSLAIMGMPIAVGHYIYTDIDRDSAEKAWKSWLDRLFAWSPGGGVQLLSRRPALALIGCGSRTVTRVMTGRAQEASGARSRSLRTG